MASITVRNLEDDVKAKLRVQAARHGRSMEAEVRSILEEALRTPAREESIADVFERIRQSAGDPDPDDDFDLMDYIPPREPMREPPTFD